MASPPLLLLVAHGSSKSVDVAAGIEAFTHTVALRPLAARFGGVRCAFLKNEPRIRDAVPTGTSTIVAPLFMAKGYFADEVVPEALGLGPHPAYDVWHRLDARAIAYLPPLGTLPGLAELTVETAIERAADVVIVVGHGTPRNAASRQSTLDVVGSLGEHGITARAAFIDDEPLLTSVIADETIEGRRILVVPYFVTDGPHVAEDIPAALGLAAGAGPRLDRLEGRSIVVEITAPVGLQPATADLLLRRAARLLDGA